MSRQQKFIMLEHHMIHVDFKEFQEVIVILLIILFFKSIKGYFLRAVVLKLNVFLVNFGNY